MATEPDLVTPARLAGVLVWRRREGAWKIVHHQGTVVAD